MSAGLSEFDSKEWKAYLQMFVRWLSYELTKLIRAIWFLQASLIYANFSDFFLLKLEKKIDL